MRSRIQRLLQRVWLLTERAFQIADEIQPPIDEFRRGIVFTRRLRRVPFPVRTFPEGIEPRLPGAIRDRETRIGRRQPIRGQDFSGLLKHVSHTRVGAFDTEFQRCPLPGAVGGFPEQIVGDVDQFIVQILLQDTDRLHLTRCAGLPGQFVPPTGSLHHRKESTHVQGMIVQQ